jgi:hypothetical protein
LDKILSKINGWRAKTYSQVGRTALIKAIAAAIPKYVMSTFIVPASICKTLHRNFKNFWWGFPSKKSQNLSLKSWKSICTLQNQGELGLLSTKATNLTLITKLGWKILNNYENIWVQ